MAMTITTERLDALEEAARRDPAGHNYYGGCVWCRADNANFLNGGAHETALSLIAEVRRLQAENEALRADFDTDAFCPLCFKRHGDCTIKERYDQ